MENSAHRIGLQAAIRAGDEVDWVSGLFGSAIGSAQELFEEQLKAYLGASGLVPVPREPSPADIWQAAMRYRHDAGLLPSSDKETLMRTAHWWHDAWVNSQPNPFESKQDE